jgi:uncharacterized protein (TIGR00251 family)
VNPVEAIEGGVLLRVHVQPHASGTGLAGRHGDALKIRLTAPPVDGAANDALIRFLAGRLGVPAAAVEVMTGHTGRRKTVRVTGPTVAEACRRLEAP